MSYSEKLRDPRWQKRRLEIFNRDGWKCRGCDCSPKELHIHHFVYSKGRDPWDYDSNFLISVCPDCHENLEVHRESVLKFMGDKIDWFDHSFSLLTDAGITRDMIIDRLQTWAKAYREFAGLDGK